MKKGELIAIMSAIIYGTSFVQEHRDQSESVESAVDRATEIYDRVWENSQAINNDEVNGTLDVCLESFANE